MWSKFIKWIKNLFKIFILDTGLLSNGLDKVIKEILSIGIDFRKEFFEWAKALKIALKREFGNIKAINKIIDSLIDYLINKCGNDIDLTTGGMKNKLEFIKNKIIKYMEEKFK